MGDATDTLHGTAVAIGDAAALILGASGAGKSDLALRCLSLAPSPLIPVSATLVADDRVHVDRGAGCLTVRAPGTILGKIEVRGLGIVSVPFQHRASLKLIVELARAESIERMPDPQPEREVLGLCLPLLRLAPFEASAPVKLLLGLMQAVQCPQGPLNS